MKSTSRFRQVVLHPAAAIGGAAALGCLIGVPPAFAQSGFIEEVIVTAQHREENIQEVPVAISSFTNQDITRLGINTAESLASVTPNLTLVPQASGNTTFAVSMRGLTATDSVVTAYSPVGIYVDGVVISKLAGGIFDFIDLERIEVLRGPQGTLYGRNTPAGAINLVTMKPSGEFGGDVTVGFGNFRQRELKFAVDTPSLVLGNLGNLGNLGSLAARLSFRKLERDGWVENTTTGKGLDSRDRHGGRLALRWLVNDDLTIDYAYDRIEIEERPPAAQLTGDYSGFLGQYVAKDRQDKIAAGYSLEPPAPGTFSIGRDLTRLTIEGHALIAEWSLSETLGLKSITGWRETDDEEPTDYDGTPIAWADFNAFVELKTFSQELQVVGSAWEDRINYVAGLYYYTEEASVRAPGVFGFGTVKQEPRFDTDNDAKAVFTQVDWRPDRFDQRLTITAGLRYTSEKRALENDVLLLNDSIELANVDHVSKTFSNTTPALTLTYAVADDVNVYFRYAEGWRSGGFNGRSSTNEQIRTPFSPESLESYELGLKSLLWERRLQLNVAAFYSDYSDLQTAITQPTATGVGFQTTNANIGKIAIRGVELESKLSVTEDLVLSFTYAWLDTDIRSYELCLPANSASCVVTNVGNEATIGLISKNSYSAAIDYRFLTLPLGNLRLNVDANYKGDARGGGQTLVTHPIEADPSYIKAYTLVNARLMWADIPLGGGTFETALWGKNLLDEDTAQFATDLRGSLDIVTTRFLTPRTYGIDFTYRY